MVFATHDNILRLAASWQGKFLFTKLCLQVGVDFLSFHCLRLITDLDIIAIEYTIQICHGISLELHPYGAILMNSRTYFQICQKKTKKQHINRSPSAAIFELFIEIILPSMQRVKHDFRV